MRRCPRFLLTFVSGLVLLQSVPAVAASFTVTTGNTETNAQSLGGQTGTIESGANLTVTGTAIVTAGTSGNTITNDGTINANGGGAAHGIQVTPSGGTTTITNNGTINATGTGNGVRLFASDNILYQYGAVNAATAGDDAIYVNGDNNTIILGANATFTGRINFDDGTGNILRYTLSYSCPSGGGACTSVTPTLPTIIGTENLTYSIETTNGGTTTAIAPGGTLVTGNGQATVVTPSNDTKSGLTTTRNSITQTMQIVNKHTSGSFSLIGGFGEGNFGNMSGGPRFNMPQTSAHSMTAVLMHQLAPLNMRALGKELAQRFSVTSLTLDADDSGRSARVDAFEAKQTAASLAAIERTRGQSNAAILDAISDMPPRDQGQLQDAIFQAIDDVVASKKAYDASYAERTGNPHPNALTAEKETELRNVLLDAANISLQMVPLEAESKSLKQQIQAKTDEKTSLLQTHMNELRSARSFQDPLSSSGNPGGPPDTSAIDAEIEQLQSSLAEVEQQLGTLETRQTTIDATFHSLYSSQTGVSSGNEPPAGITAWAEVYGSYRERPDYKSSSYGVSRNGGVVVGMGLPETEQGYNITLYLSGFTGQSKSGKPTVTTTDSAGFMVGAGVSKIIGAYSVSGQLAAGYTDNDSDRVDGTSIAKSDFGTSFISPGLTVARSVQADGVTWVPSVNVSYNASFTEGHTETGGTINQTIGDKTSQSVSGRLQMAANFEPVELQNGNLSSNIRVGIEGQTDIGNRSSDMRVLGTNLTLTPKADRTVDGIIGFGFDYDMPQKELQLYADGEASVGLNKGGASDNAGGTGKVGLRWKF